jgi:hypothetical protein
VTIWAGNDRESCQQILVAAPVTPFKISVQVESLVTLTEQGIRDKTSSRIPQRRGSPWQPIADDF